MKNGSSDYLAEGEVSLPERPAAPAWLRFPGMLIAPTRAVVDALRDHFGWLKDAQSIIVWNVSFQVLAIAFCFSCEWVWRKPAALVSIPMALIAFFRINELVYAFYRDAMDRIEGYRSSTKFTPGQRVRLLLWAYAELILQFSVIHFSIQTLSRGRAYTGISDFASALYFSGVTVTTTGFGDIHPSETPARIASLFESVTDVLFIGLSLAVYLSSRPAPAIARIA